jgi:hypothetical protein
MTTETPGSEDTGPLELLESARAKYTLAQARMRRGPPELALLALHGSLEDALRAHALRRQLPAAYEPFPQMLEALTSDSLAPLTAPEAEGIQRMHRLRGRVARGEQISVTAETIDAYQRLVARLLPRYGVLVVGPEDLPGTPPTGTPARPAERIRPLPARERTTYPDDRETRSTMPARSAAERIRRRPPDDDPRYERRPTGTTASRRYLEETAERVETLSRVQSWLVPLLIIVSIFMIGATISIGWQQLGASRQPTSPPAPTFNPAITTVEPAFIPDPQGQPAAPLPTPADLPPTPAPTELPADTVAVGRPAFVRADLQLELNVRAAPSSTAEIRFVLAPNTQMDVIGGPVEADGFTWWEISSAGRQGWAAGEFLTVR